MYKFGITVLAVIAIACGRNSISDPAHPEDSHQQEMAASQSTLFTSQTEFFIEHEPLVLGKESGFLVHVTQLDSYKPYLSGTLTIRLHEKVVTAREPERPGIFHIPIIPENAGELQVTYTLESGTILESVTEMVYVYHNHDAVEIAVHDQDAEEADHNHEDETLEPGEIVFLKEQAWKSDFMAEQVQPAPFSSVISTSGEILAMPGEKKSVSANSSGILIFNNKTLVQGSQVKKGQFLFTLTSKTLTRDNIELQFQELLNSFTRSKSEFERHRDLYSKNVISERQFIESKTGYTSDSLRFHSLAANATNEGLIVTSPVTGYIHHLNVSEGQYVETGELLVTISTNKVLLLRADVPQQFYKQLNEIETANFRPAYSDHTYSVADLNGRLLAKASSVAENDHYMPVYFVVENDGSLLEGAFTEFFLKSRTKESHLAVPLEALAEEQGTYYLYVQVTGESFTKRSVIPGENDGRRVEILEGLLPGERIVTRGTMLLKAASTVTPVSGHGHAH